MIKKWFFPIIVLFFLAAGIAGSNSINSYPELDIRNDENLMFFPSYCFYDKNSNTYHIRFHAWVYEPEVSSKKRKILISAISSILDLDEEQIAESLFEKRAAYLLYDNESRKWVSAGYGGEPYNLGVTDATGHTERELVMPPEIFARGLPEGTNLKEFKKAESWVTFKALTVHNRDRVFEGRAKYIPPDGVMIVSDIDDTIKITEVNDKKKLMENTFLKPYIPVEGMSGVYSLWESEGASFVYLSASPWQLYEPLTEFLADENFPEGVMQMKVFDLPSGVKTIFDSPEKVKLPALKKLMKSFPQKKFILIGDSGEKDPEIYGKIASQYKDRIAWILIRNVNNESSDSKRIKSALGSYPAERFRLFKDSSELYFLNMKEIR